MLHKICQTVFTCSGQCVCILSRTRFLIPGTFQSEQLLIEIKMCWFRHCLSHRLRTSTTRFKTSALRSVAQPPALWGRHDCAAHSTRVPHSAAFCRSLFETKVSQVEISSVGRVETRFAIITENCDGQKFTALRYL